MALVLVCGCVLGLVMHRLRVRDAEAAYVQSRLTREVAETALAEFAQAIAKQDVKSVEAEISLAENDLKIAHELLDRSRRQAEKTNITKPEFTENEREIRVAEQQLHQVRRKKMNVEATNVRTIEELKSEVEKARGVERAKKAIYTQAKSRWMSRLIW